MKLLRVTSFSFIFLSTTHALICWQCENEPSNKRCLQNGRAMKCSYNERTCQNEVRRGSFGLLITKSCKQPQACKSNLLSLKFKWWPDGMYCNTKAANAVCRCCCSTDNCNKGTIGCRTPNTKTTPSIITAPKTISKAQTTPTTTTSRVVMTTLPRNPTPHRALPSCDNIAAPSNGGKSCFPGKNKRGRYDIETECEFSCAEGLYLEGSPTSSCTRVGNSEFAKFDRSTPICRRCERLRPIKNGDISCSNELDQVCFFECNSRYTLYPPGAETSRCLNNTEWSTPPPCCLRDCPPHAYMDMILLLDSSQTAGEKKFELMKDFTADIIQTFNIGPGAARFSVVAFNSDVDRDSQILLRDFPKDKAGLLKAVQDIPYSGKGRRDTGAALEYAQNVLMRTSSGDRRAPNVVLVITDGEAYDDETVYINSMSLRLEGVFTFAVGVVPSPPSQLNLEQLELIGGSPENVFIAERGFKDLNRRLVRSIGSQICSIRTCERAKAFENLFETLLQGEMSPK